jgi:hypothetical protein
MRHLKLALAFLFALASASMAAQPIKSSSSGNVANASAVATIAGGAQSWTYLTGFEATFAGATAGQCVNLTITGTLGGTLTYPVCSPTGVTVQGYPFGFEFIPPLQSAAVNTSIVVTLPALGAGNTNAAVTAHGYVE